MAPSWPTAGLWKRCITSTVAGLKPVHFQDPYIAQRNAPRRLLSDTSLAAMGKVHGSLARAGKVKNQTPKALLKVAVAIHVNGTYLCSFLG